MKYLPKRKANDAKLEDARQLDEVYRTKANKMSRTMGRCAQKVDDALAQMAHDSESANEKLRQIQSCLSKLCALAHEAGKSHNGAVAGGQAAAAVATQLLRAGAPDMEKALSYSDDELHTEAEAESRGEPETCMVILTRGARKNELCGRRYPCPFHRHRPVA